MNRDHVGMLFKFLPKEEQDELRNLKPNKREYLSEYNDSDIPSWIVDDSKIDDAKDQYRAYRPKGFLSWNEMREDFERLYLGKKIKFIGDGPEEEYTCKFTGKWLTEEHYRAQAEMKGENGTFDFFPEFYEDLPGYGFEVVS